MNVGGDRSLDSALYEGMRRVASLVEGMRDVSYVLGPAAEVEFQSTLMVNANEPIPTHIAAQYLDHHIVNTRYRAYRAPSNISSQTTLGYSYSLNNRKEIANLASLCSDVGINVDIENVCDWRVQKGTGVSPTIATAVATAFAKFSAGRAALQPGLLRQIAQFAVASHAALETLRSVPSLVFVVANDHSPSPVAYASIARHLGMKLVYVQHAEVSEIFPPLDFDLSILRNQRSKQTYSAIGSVRGEVIVRPQHTESWLDAESVSVRQRDVVEAHGGSVVVYPSSVVDTSHLRSVIESLTANPNVHDVALKAHPNSRVPFDSNTLGVNLIESVPDYPHVAVCGNSSIVVELLTRGSVVFQDFGLDDIVPDYYAFTELGLSQSISRSEYGKQFWKSYQPLDDDKFATLADLLPNLVSRENLLESAKAVPKLLQAFAPAGVPARTLAEGWRNRWLQSDLLMYPNATIHEFRRRTDPYGDEQTLLRSLRSLPSPAVSAVLASVNLDSLRCDSLLESWIAIAAVEAHLLEPSEAQLESLRRYFETPHESSEVTMWQVASAALVA